MASAATSSGIAAATSDAKTSKQDDQGERERDHLGALEVLLGLGGQVPGERSVAGQLTV